ncbi:bifunctional biotin--[acetyl-CoA-carboxylase] ligase/biotin operon repressor BirA [Psychromonas antarctica]|jgi:BirA family biotin operon repressor/biotin-[acetyl-CoA-carboxylase] ligase|uniref:bifunctional biotin--[acetyl-CoA-carboxylase] ligase/biotin operon repressor BirA n=1 Tax=Psychromonas antarctica TaxID=67573 RepID=UPI001EE8787C|nr:bifunctional biotin--[acetyl-CoA-carboxylase] ligase/biotin operon repressor BirA [Psychromonas antarctica]MCG6201155.1 bifunctional biotin--[acetyl-CoA-carboxylase] ligase/biotin operon repressor BirA [Psychromonas antarctica]
MSELNEQGNILLTLLADGEFHSGEKIGELLGVSRTSVNNYIKALQEIGLDIYKVTGRGYCSAAPITLLDKDKIEQLSNSRTVHVEQIVDSTNQWLLDRIANLKNGQSCISEYQLSGRGRRGRSWVSPFASHLYFSFYWRFDSGIDKVAGLSLLVGIATVNALEKIGVQGVSLKWPNDLYYQGKKLAGILIELNAQATEACHSVIGIGINVRMPAQQAKLIDQPWTDLTTLSSQPIDRNLLSATLINELTTLLIEYEQSGLGPHLQRWFALDYFFNKEVKLLIADRVKTGICRGINETGALLLECDGVIEPYIGGEISLRLAD